MTSVRHLRSFTTVSLALVGSSGSGYDLICVAEVCKHRKKNHRSSRKDIAKSTASVSRNANGPVWYHHRRIQMLPRLRGTGYFTGHLTCAPDRRSRTEQRWTYVQADRSQMGGSNRVRWRGVRGKRKEQGERQTRGDANPTTQSSINTSSLYSHGAADENKNKCATMRDGRGLTNKNTKSLKLK